MKSVSAGLQAVIDAGDVQWIFIYKLKLRNGDIKTYSEHDQPLNVDLDDGDGATVFEPGTITEVSSPDSSLGTSIDSKDFNGAMQVIDLFGLDKDDIVSGRLDGAELTAARCHHPNPALGAMIDSFQYVGDVSSKENIFELSTRSLISRFDARATFKIQPQCRWEFGSVECGYDLTGQTHTGEVVSQTDARRIVTDIIQASNYFEYGVLEFTSGRNTGLKYDVNTSGDAGEIELSGPPRLPIQDGDEITCTRGCKKNKAACVGYGNFVNFGGFPYVPGVKLRNQRGTN